MTQALFKGALKTSPALAEQRVDDFQFKIFCKDLTNEA